MPGGKGWKRNKSFTSETKISFSNMLYGIVDLIRKLLNEDHQYVLPGIFQTDRLEGEFGIYRFFYARQLCGGKYHVSVEEVKNSLRLQRLKLFSKLDAMGVAISQCSIIQSECCQLDLNEDDISYLDTSVSSIDAISEEENAALYYISGYVQHKFLPSISVSGTFVTNASKFTELVSCGRLCHPTEDLFQYVRYAYSLFILLPNAEMRFQCVRYISKLFIYFYTALPFDLQALPINTVVSTILNCFFKGLTKLNESSDKVSLNIEDHKVKKFCK
ncbi:uncharacterized protein LOC124819347 isoform X1 [Hydra vulgaris]|uniref:uncharacterized protein LOC124819347 isoform X1 n=1 Tax=Hydra vulgaris TaxID=6087 RepID=UPI001F5EF72C|nr:uncharacterized protein LOC124819347 isoform X1 [Hydra vulgaris]